jgi:hypothetical protein
MALQITFTGDDEAEITEQVKAWLEAKGAAPEAEEETQEEETQEEEQTEEEGGDLLGEETQEEEDPMQILRDKIVEKIRAMSKKPADVAKIRDAFKKVKIAKFDDDVKDAKLAPLAKLLGVKA